MLIFDLYVFLSCFYNLMSVNDNNYGSGEEKESATSFWLYVTICFRVVQQQQIFYFFTSTFNFKSSKLIFLVLGSSKFRVGP